MSIEDDIVFFEGVPMLRLLGRQALRVLAIGAESRYVHGGETLFRMGDAADAGYVVQEGSFRLTTGDSKTARETAPVAGPGAMLGEFGLIARTLHPTNAVAVEPSTVIRISRTLFMKMLEGHPDSALRLRDHFVDRVAESANDLATLRQMFQKADTQ
jgi:CRP-like cAMP-binding protein